MFASNVNLAAAGQIEPGEQAEQGGFPRARSADDGDGFAGIHRHFNGVEYPDFPIGAKHRFAETGSADDR